MEKFTHVRIVMGMIVSLGLTHMLKGLSSAIQHPGKTRIYPVHMAWVASMVLYILHFWWWEFSLREIAQWTFGIYLYLLFYAFIIYLLCSMLFPDSLKEYDGYEDYFMSRRAWFFGLLFAVSLVDVGDSVIKGEVHLSRLGDLYWLRTAMVAICCLVAIRTRNRLFHTSFVALNLAAQVLLIVHSYWSDA
ncbi:hypothetical protein EN871_08035 [bacterium M00.F.Ca.ET.228.01.1.1]|uniref:hypothetical protein n=1 Tax=Paraburkholderia phenoliruptrix TaxID=252970 RepID=UPI001091B396|nr:hypothetical protein [Paraburkholderia phenoliruptrix]MBW9131801.1 hypothetical protein [Paraburkholderia ginsengiterrae]TGP46382.1 hypothetical protein EN871_08035 [bacterium M00.F.Ca.ET.228.01.1.1]TGS03704.1 hypothetical protein EN834_04950 [bacterium M00.F.Ca.ET.191.01.1.1]TGU07676.1 hypothetical protein EN798_12110 [bacterium M00.F.Ca.ET.155.01.1.1]MBW0446201.1 hypothetical protein [Paraburkholderia phenoliruptrix]